MKIYLVVWEDRHQDVEVTAFVDKSDALEHLDEIVSNYELSSPYGLFRAEGEKWIKDVRLTNEGDYVRVEEVELHGELHNRGIDQKWMSN